MSAGGNVGCGVFARRGTFTHGKRIQRGHGIGIYVECKPLKGVQLELPRPRTGCTGRAAKASGLPFNGWSWYTVDSTSKHTTLAVDKAATEEFDNTNHKAQQCHRFTLSSTTRVHSTPQRKYSFLLFIDVISIFNLPPNILVYLYIIINVSSYLKCINIYFLLYLTTFLRRSETHIF